MKLREASVGVAVGGLAGSAALSLGLPALVSYWGTWAPLAVGAAGLGGAMWCTRLRPVVAAVAAVLSMIWLAVAFSPLSLWLAQGLVRRDPLRDGDAVFVLSSRIQADGDPTTSAMSRLLHGLELVAAGRAPRLILSELPSPSRSYADVARAWTEHLKVRTDLLTVGPVRNTHDEAVAVGALFRQHGWKTVLLVTSPDHSRRAAASFEREGLGVVSSPAVETRFDLETLDFSDDRLDAFGSLLHERIGLLVYRWRGWVR